MKDFYYTINKDKYYRRFPIGDIVIIHEIKDTSEGCKLKSIGIKKGDVVSVVHDHDDFFTLRTEFDDWFHNVRIGNGAEVECIHLYESRINGYTEDFNNAIGI